MFFALEVLLRRFSTRNFSVIVLSSVVATVTAIQLRGDELAIPVVTHHGLNSAAEAPFYVVLGVVCGLCGVAFIRIFYWTEDGFARLSRVPEWLLPAIGRVLVGGLALFDASILGIREGARDAALLGEGAVGAMLAPITSTLILVEMTGDFDLMAPLLIAIEALNLFTSQRLRALPVVEADSPRRPAGLLCRAHIMRACAEAVDRRASRDRRQRLRPVRRSDNVRYLELRVTPESNLDGTLLSDLRLTDDAVIVAVRHPGRHADPARPYAPRSRRPRHHHRRCRLRRRGARHLRGPPVTDCPARPASGGAAPHGPHRAAARGSPGARIR